MVTISLIYSNSNHNFPECSLPASCKVVPVLLVVVMSIIFLVTLLGNLATIVTIKSDSHSSSYQQLQISLCCADLLLSLSGPLSSAVVNLLFLTHHLNPEDFMRDSLFHKFQHSEEAEAASFGSDNVIKTNLSYLILSAVGISLSTTVSIVTIACMAILRWAITAGQFWTEKIKTMEKYLKLFLASVWIFGRIYSY